MSIVSDSSPVLIINKKRAELDVTLQMPLLWVIRDIIGLTGTKFGCGMAQCGACRIHLNGEAVRSCVTPVSHAIGGKIVTIEGLSVNRDHPLQQASAEVNVPQCGYCQSGQIMSAAFLLRETPILQIVILMMPCLEIFVVAKPNPGYVKRYILLTVFMYLQMLHPARGKDALPNNNVEPPFPEGSIGFLNAISSIGTSFRRQRLWGRKARKTYRRMGR